MAASQPTKKKKRERKKEGGFMMRIRAEQTAPAGA